MLRMAAKHKRLSVRSGHKTGKSMSAAILAWWWVHRYPRGRVIMTATTNAQIRNILWREIRALRRKARISLPEPAHLPAIGVQWDDGREIIGFSTKDAEKMAGVSGSHLLFIVDEASGVTEDIFEAIEGNRAGGAHIVMFSNPTQPAGTFYDSFHSSKRFWKNIHVSSTEAAKTGIPGLATKEWCEEKLVEWGPDSPLYQVRVAGIFPTYSSDAIVPLWSVEAARTREVAPQGELLIGVDPARFGDDESTIAPVRGRHAYPIKVKTGMDTQQVAKVVLDTVREHHVKGEPKPKVNIDSIGIGAGVFDKCVADYQEEMDVYEVNVSESANNDVEYMNARAEMWFNLAEWMVDADIPDDDKLHQDLVAPRYDFDRKNRRLVEDKKKIKDRLGRSPDRAEGLGLAVYRPKQPLVWTEKAKRATTNVRIEIDSRWHGMPIRGF